MEKNNSNRIDGMLSVQRLCRTATECTEDGRGRHAGGRYESTTFAMDTVMTFHIVAPDGEDLLIDAEQEVKRLEKLFSVTDEDSDIEQIIDNAGVRRLPFRQIRLPC